MPSATLVSLADIARHHSRHLDHDPYRSVLGFFTDLGVATDAQVARAIGEEPPPSDNKNLDALLAAAAEHVAFHRDLAAPPWCESSARFLATAWFPVDLPSVRVTALVSSPASFARRGVFIDRRDLDRI